MSTYKVLQDIEAEDKLVGPFSLRQFIYAGIAAVSAFIGFKLATFSIFFIIPFLPVVILFAVLAAPFGHDQPSEVWLLARVRFFLKPHRRIWDQSGMVNLVTIMVPKVVPKILTKNLTPEEVNSRLVALANTIDSRGWAIKNVNVNISDQSGSPQKSIYSDRLVNPTSAPQDLGSDITAADDILDAQNNPTAAHFDQMIASASRQQRQQIVEKMNNGYSENPTQNPSPDYWFMNGAGKRKPVQPTQNQQYPATSTAWPGVNTAPVIPEVSDADYERLLNEATPAQKADHQQSDDNSTNNLDNVQNTQQLDNLDEQTDPQSITDPAIIDLAWADKDKWSVATIAHQAEIAKKRQQSQDEVVVNLH